MLLEGMALLAVIAIAAIFVLPSLDKTAPLAAATPSAAPLVQPSATVSATAQPSAAASPSPVHVAEEVEPVVEDAAIYQALSENGVNGSVVDFQQGKILVSFLLPKGFEQKRAAFLALGIAGPFSLEGQQIFVEVLLPEGGFKVYSVIGQDVKRFARGEITDSQFEALVSVK